MAKSKLTLAENILPHCDIGLDEGRRADDEADWISTHPGFQFGIYVKGELRGIAPSIPVARRKAKKYTGRGYQVRIKDINHPDRSYWHEGTEDDVEN